MFADGGSIGAIVAAIISGSVGLVLSRQNRQIHREVKTNHGLRAGEYLEKISTKQDAIERQQGVVALALMGANAKVDDVARKLVVSERKRDEEAEIVRTHIAEDAAFQQRIEPILSAVAAAPA